MLFHFRTMCAAGLQNNNSKTLVLNLKAKARINIDAGFLQIVRI
jgi:hypothetical protein